MPLLMKIPIVMWSEEPPSHTISCVLICSNGMVVTGSMEGQLIFWAKKESECKTEIVPHSMILAHSGAVEAIVDIKNSKLEIDSALISLSDHQEICLWNTETCCCLTSRFLKGRFDSLKTIYISDPRVVRECLLACYGNESSLVILDPFSLQTLYIFKQPLSQPAIGSIMDLAVCSCEDSRKYLLALTRGSRIVIWEVPKQKRKDNKNIVRCIISNKVLKNLHLSAPHSFCVEKLKMEYIVLCDVHNIIILKGERFDPILQITTRNFIASVETLASGSFIVTYQNRCPQIIVLEQDPVAYRRIDLPQFERELSQNITYCTVFTEISGQTVSAMVAGVSSFNKVLLWQIDLANPTPQFLTARSVSLQQVWTNSNQLGILGRLTDSLSLKNTRVTSSLQLRDFGFMIFGLSDGNILVASAMELVMRQLLDSEKNTVCHMVLTGHRGAVTCVCYPFEDCDKHNPCHLLSGGVDFSIRLWNIVTGQQLRVYYPHGGFIQDIIVTNNETVSPTILTFISVASDYSVCLINLLREKEMLITRSHTAPVCSVKYRPREDSLFVFCADGNLFIWHIRTGNLERCVAGRVAIEIFYREEEDTSPNDTFDSGLTSKMVSVEQIQDNNKTNGSGKDGGKRKKFSHWPHLSGHHLVSGKKKYLNKMFQKMSSISRNRFNSKQKQAQCETSPPSINTLSLHMGNTNSSSLGSLHSSVHSLTGQQNSSPVLNEAWPCASMASNPPFDVISCRTGLHDSNFHLFVIHTDVLISQLLTEEVQHSLRVSIAKTNSTSDEGRTNSRIVEQTTAKSSSQSQTLALTVLKMGLCPTSDHKAYRKYCQALLNYNARLLENSALFLVSCLYPWGLNSVIDDLGCKNLGLSYPRASLLYGLVSHNKIHLNMPGWFPTNFSIGSINSSPESRPRFDSVSEKHLLHYKISSVVTTQHWISLIALNNSFLKLTNYESHELCNEMVENKFNTEFQKTISGRDYSSTQSSNAAPFSSCNHPKLPQSKSKRADWIKFYHHTQESITLLRERLFYSTPLIHDLILYWIDSAEEIRTASYNVLMTEFHFMGTNGRKKLIRSWSVYLPTPDEVERTKVQDLLGLPANEVVESGGFYGFWPGDKKYRRTVAVFLTAFLAVEFSEELDPLRSKFPNSIEAPIAISTIMMIANIIVKTLISPINLKTLSSCSYPLRRAFNSFIGKDFHLWQPHINSSQMLVCLLDSISTMDIYKSYIEANNKNRSLAHLRCIELSNGLRDTLKSILFQVPEVVISSLSKEISKHSSVSNFFGLGQSALMAASVYTTLRHHQNPLASHPNMLQIARKEIVNLIDMFASTTHNNFKNFIVEAVDLLLNCSPHKLLKREHNVLDIFTFLKPFNCVDFCEHSKRLAVGSLIGKLVLYDIKNLKSNLVIAHLKPLTCLKFSPSGKNIVTFSYAEANVSVWDTHVPILALMVGTPRIHARFNITIPSDISPEMEDKIYIKWQSNNSFKLLFNQQHTLLFTL